MKKYLFFTFLFVLNLGIARGETFNILIPKYEIRDNRVIIDGFGSILEPGKPWLPSRVIRIAIPPCSKVIECSAKGVLQLISSQHDTCSIISVPMLVKEGESLLKVKSEKLKVEGQNVIYPDSVGKYLGTFEFRGYKFAKVLISPVAYNQETRELWWTPEITINLDYTHPTETIQVDTTLDNLLFSLDTIGHVPTYEVLNLDKANKWYERTLLDSYDYVIVVPKELRTVVKDFAEWKETIGYKVKIVSPENPESIGSPKYILVIGDSMETQNSKLRTQSSIVGRIPYTDADILKSILERTIEFEINGVTKEVLFVKGVSNYENEDFSGIPQEDKSSLLEKLKSIVPMEWSYEESKNEGIAGNYPIINFLTLSKNWLLDDGDGVPESKVSEIKLSKYFLCSGVPSFVFAPFDTRELLKQGAVCIVAPDSGVPYIPGWSDVSDGGSQSFNYMFLKYLMENEKVGDAFIRTKFWYETHFPNNTQGFKIWGDPSLNLRGIPKIDIGITETPVKWLPPDSAFSPVCMVYNFGRTPDVNCKIYCEIDSGGVPVYMKSIVLDTIGVKMEKRVEFPEWSEYQVGVDYRVNFKVFSHRDANPSNDTLGVLAYVIGGDFLVSDTVLNNALCELGYKGVLLDKNGELKIKNEWLENFKVLFVSGEIDSIPDSLPKNLYIEGSNLWLDGLMTGQKISEPLVSPISGMGFSFDSPDTCLEWFLPDDYDTTFLDGEGEVCGFSCEDKHKVWCTRFLFSEIPDSMRMQFIEEVMHFFEIEAPDSSTSMKEAMVDSNIILFSCFPNPFSQNTHIKFNVQKYPTKINLSVYSLAGTLVRKLFDGFLDCGRYEFGWDGCSEGEKPVVNGIYFLRLQAEKEKKLLKLVVFK